MAEGNAEIVNAGELHLLDLETSVPREENESDLVGDLFHMERSDVENQYVDTINALTKRQRFCSELQASAEENLSETPMKLTEELCFRNTTPKSSDGKLLYLQSPKVCHSRDLTGLTAKLLSAEVKPPPQNLVASSAARKREYDKPEILKGDRPEAHGTKCASPSLPKSSLITVPEGLYLLPNDLLCLPTTNAAELLYEIFSRRLTSHHSDNPISAVVSINDEDSSLSPSGMRLEVEPPRKRVKHCSRPGKNVAVRKGLTYVPSSHCHICGRKSNTKFTICSNFLLQACKKVLCTKCILLYENQTCSPNGPVLDAEHFSLHVISSRECPHCRNACPRKARCTKYNAMNNVEVKNNRRY